MELQLALDFISIEDSIELLKEVGDSIDIVEIGTPFIVKDGMRAVREVRRAFPDLKILADLKIMDAGKEETACAVEAAETCADMGFLLLVCICSFVTLS